MKFKVVFETLEEFDLSKDSLTELYAHLTKALIKVHEFLNQRLSPDLNIHFEFVVRNVSKKRLLVIDFILL